MQIDFFEEFLEKSLAKFKLIGWPCLVYLAAPSLKQFRKLERKAKTVNPKLKCGYWPILKKREGYWLSPWSERKALIRIIDELKQNKRPLVLLWDWEKPFLTPYLFVTQVRHKEKNKQLIYDFFKRAKQYKIKLALGELSPQIDNRFGDRRILMAYSSFGLVPVSLLKKKIAQGRKFKSRLWMGLGCIAPGILRIEPRLSPEGLDRDLSIVKKSRVNKVVIFRLGGLNKEYVRVLKKYL